jgi:peptidyl-prolyl cis-trans isomerase A (cyclophilin A)
MMLIGVNGARRGMRCPHAPLVRLVAVVSALTLWTQVCAAQAEPNAPLSAAQRRALLMDPSRAFWRTTAPDTVTLDVETSRGTITIELIREWAPNGVDRFYNLARAAFFDDSRFYRVLPFYIAQFGQPGNPTVGAIWRERKIRPDSVRSSNVRGTLTYAQFTPKDRSTTLFINLRDNLALDSLKFAPIGRVIEGMEAADSLYSGYGEIPTSKPPIGNPRRFYGESNKFLDKAYPKLDRIVSIKVRE